MKSVMTTALMLLFVSGAWAETLNIRKQLNGVDNDAAGEVIFNTCNKYSWCLTVTPAEGNYVTVEYITAYNTVTGEQAQVPRRERTLDNGIKVVTCTTPDADPSGVTEYEIGMTGTGINIDVIINFQSRKPLTLDMVANIVAPTYTGAAWEPDLTIKDGEFSLVKNTHYTVEYSDNVDAGTNTAKATITGKGIYTTNTGEATSIVKTFTINPMALTEEMVSPLADVEYNGEAQKPEVIISDGGYQLVYGKDYWTAYPDSINAGRARCEINGKGNYTGQITRYYTIEQADFNVTIAEIPDQEATGKPIEPELTVTFKNTNNTIITVAASDYNADYSNNTNAGTATVILSSTGKNFKIGLTQTKTFKINAIEDYLSIKDGDAFLSKLRVTNGNTFNIKEHFQVVCPEDIPEENLTWTSRNECVSVDNGVITAEGYGNAEIVLSYAGDGKYAEDNYTFYVDATPKTPMISLPAGAYPSDQTAITITKENVAGMAISYTWDDITGDNDATWKNYTDEGVVFQEGTLSARVGYTPAAGGTTIYSDTVSVAYTILVQKEITADMVILEKETYDYTGETITPDVKVYDSEKGAYLVKDTDYELSCQNNINVGTATVTVTGKVNYKGSVEKTFEIVYRATGAQLDAAMAGNTYGTFYNNDNDTYLPDGYSAYYITAVSGTTATTQSITFIPKGNAVLVAKLASTSATAPGAGNMMIHLTVDTDVTTMAGTIYGLYKDKLMRVGMGTIAAGKNVLQVTDTSGTPELSIAVGDDTTGIGTVGCDSVATDNDALYTLDGRKLLQAPAQKGLYIKNGKVVVINK